MAHVTGLSPTYTHNGITSAGGGGGGGGGGDMSTCWLSTGTNRPLPSCPVVWFGQSDAYQTILRLLSGVPAVSIVRRRSRLIKGRLIKENRKDATIQTTDLLLQAADINS